MNNTKVYRYRKTKVINQVQKALKKRQRESTVADLVLATALPEFQVRESLTTLSAEYQGHLKATESGELIYYFPKGFRNPAKSLSHRIRNLLTKIGGALYKAFTLFFKGWIMFMLIGYFVLFIALIVLSIIASIAGSASGNGERRGRKGGFLSFYFTMRLVELLFSFWTLKSLNLDRQGRPQKKKKRSRPLYKSIFAFVFGDSDPSAGWEESRIIRTLNFIRRNKGVISEEELAHLNGTTLEESNSELSKMAILYNGEPRVSENGTVYYFFPELLKTTGTIDQSALSMKESRSKIPFNNNSPKENNWIGFINGFNLVLGSYFFIYSFFWSPEMIRSGLSILFQYVVRFLAPVFGQAEPTFTFIGVVLGVIPLVFSALFYLVPFLRNLRRKRKNKKIEKQQIRKKVLNHLFKNSDSANPERAVLDAGYVPNGETLRLAEKCFDEVGRYSQPQIDATAGGSRIWRFDEISHNRKEMEAVRQNINPEDYETGGTVFDSGTYH